MALKKKRKRIARPDRIRAIVMVADAFDVSYKQALEAYNSAKGYCKVFKNKTVLQETEFILLMDKSNFVNKL